MSIKTDDYICLTDLRAYSKNKNLLIVEDENVNAKILSNAFEDYFQNIFLASNGKDALDIFYSNKIDIILTDLSMPVMSGGAFVEKIRHSSNVPIIMLSSNEDKDEFIKLINIGITKFIPKPFNFNIVALEIEKALENLKYKELIDAENCRICKLQIKKELHKTKNNIEKKNTKKIISTLPTLSANELYGNLVKNYGHDYIIKYFEKIKSDSILLENSLVNLVYYSNEKDLHVTYDKAEAIILDIIDSFKSIVEHMSIFKELLVLSNAFEEFIKFFSSVQNFDYLNDSQIEEFLNFEFVFQDIKECIKTVFINKNAENIYIYPDLLMANLNQIESDIFNYESSISDEEKYQEGELEFL
jgi:DNA-binding response OmpR family regulator